MNKPSRPVLSVRNLHRSYPSGGGILRVMAGADIDIYPGEMVGLIGPSGSGKSTLLHAAGLLETPNEGEVFINCLLYTSPSPRDQRGSRMPSSA